MYVGLHLIRKAEDIEPMDVVWGHGGEGLGESDLGSEQQDATTDQKMLETDT